MNQTMDKLASS